MDDLEQRVRRLIKLYGFNGEADDPSYELGMLLNTLNERVATTRRAMDEIDRENSDLRLELSSHYWQGGRPDQAWILDLLKIVADDKYTDDCATENLLWRLREDGLLAVAMNCSDVFEWGCADCEDITENDLADIAKARDEVRAAAPGIHNVDRLVWTELWVARKRGMRPQGAFFRRIDSDEVKQLFANAGPQRQGGVLGDPDHIELEQR